MIYKKVGNRIYLRTLTQEDASEDYCAWLNDPDVNQFLETRKTTREDLQQYIQDKQNNPNTFLLGIFVKNNDKHIGNVKLEILYPEQKRADFGIIIGDKNYWGSGFGAEATKLALDFAFQDLDLREVELGVLEKNRRARKVFEKCGFKKFADKKNFTNHDGVWHNAILMKIRNPILAKEQS